MSNSKCTSSPKDIETFLDAWEATPVKKQPFPHYVIRNAVPKEIINSSEKIPHQIHNLDYQVGSREEFNKYRQYLTPEVISKNNCAKRISDLFLSHQVINTIEKKGNISLKDTLLRIEHTIDRDKFWLSPHTDLGVKKFTALLYLSQGDNMETWGTDIYYDKENYCETVPYEPNTMLIFFPSNITWHGFEPREIKGIRRTFIINYVTQEWRNKQELVHPTECVY